MRKEKQYLLDEIAEPMAKKGSFVILSYEKVRANTVNQFRRDVASMGGEVKMMRKRILMRAFATSGIDVSSDQLPGHISLVFSGNDSMELLKRAFVFSKETDKNAKVVGGHIDGKLYNAADAETLSKLPGKDEMRAQFLATLEAPMSQTLAVMEALLTSVVFCLDNKSKEGAEPAA